MQAMQIIATINQKGGVGKTTTTANLASALAARGLNVALIDLDPQSHLTMHFGLEPGAATPGTYEVLTAEAGLAAAAVRVQPHLSLVPSSIDLAGAEIELVSAVGRERLLADRLDDGSFPYDYVFIDCPPSLGLLTLNALAAADEVLIPLQPHFLALQGLGKLLETIALVRQRINPRLRVGGVLLCMYESGTRLAAEVTEDVTAFLANADQAGTPWAGAKVYQTRIRRNIKLAESPSFGKTIFHYAPTSHGAADYEALAVEFLLAHRAPDEGEPPAGEAGASATDESSEAPASAAEAPPTEAPVNQAEAPPAAPPAEAPMDEAEAPPAEAPVNIAEMPPAAAPPVGAVIDNACAPAVAPVEAAGEPPAPATDGPIA